MTERAYGTSVKRFVQGSAPNRGPNPSPVASIGDVGDDEYIFGLSIEPQKLDTAERSLMFSLFEDGIYSAVFFAQFMNKEAWPFAKRHAIRDAILALDWIFEPDPEPYIYNFETCADVLQLDAEYWRNLVRDRLGEASAISTAVLRGKLWLRKVNLMIVNSIPNKKGMHVLVPQIGNTGYYIFP
jgi:hypothetical protein